MQFVGVEKGTIKFKNCFKQIPVSFKIYADIEYNLESTEVYEGSYTKKDHDHVPCSFPYRLICDCNYTRTHNHLVGKQTLNHLAKQTK